MSVERAEIADAAAEYLRDHGWNKGLLKSPSGRACLVGALDSVAPWLSEADPALRRFLMRWNDDPSRTMEEVLGLLTRVAAQERAEAQ